MDVDLSGYTQDQLLAILEDLDEYQDAKSRSPISFYTPNPVGQEDFHLSPSRTRLLMGGNRSGKSTAGAVEAVSHAIGIRPWLPKEHEGYEVRNALGKIIKVPNVGTILGESYKISVDRVLWPTIEEWLPKGLIKRIGKNQQGTPDTVEFFNGSKIRFMTYNQDPKEFEGFKAHWAWYDEPPRKSIFIANERSLVDYSGRSWFTLTPIRQPWIWEDLVSREGENPDIATFRMSSWDNPYLSRRSLSTYFEQIKNPEERRARELGEFLHLQGRVFPMWQPTPPYFVDPFVPKQDWIRVMAIDPHPRKPIACVWCAISPHSGIWYAYRELWDPDIRTIGECARKIKYLERGEDISFRIIDPSSQENEKTSDTSVYEQFMDYGILPLELAQRWDKLGRISLLQERFDIDQVYQSPTFVVMKNCMHLRHELMNMIWDDWATHTRDDKEPKPEVKKKDDDLVDGILYLLQYGQEARDFKPEVGASWRAPEMGGVYLPARPASPTGY